MKRISMCGSLKKTRLKKIKLEIGRQSDYDYEVLSGLKEGDIIAIDANDTKIKEGMKIKIKNEE